MSESVTRIDSVGLASFEFVEPDGRSTKVLVDVFDAALEIEAIVDEFGEDSREIFRKYQELIIKLGGPPVPKAAAEAFARHVLNQADEVKKKLPPLTEVERGDSEEIAS